MDITITKHAYKRAKERCGWSKSSMNRMISRIYERGIDIKDIKGALRPWAEVKLESGGMKESKIYADTLFVIKGGMLVTLYHLPGKVRVQNKICKRHIIEFYCTEI